MKKKIRTKVGDIFQIPIGIDNKCFGQVLTAKNGCLRIATFDKLFKKDDHPPVDEIFKLPIFLLTDTMDAKIWHGDWVIFSNANLVAENLPKPRFKINDDPTYIINYEMTRQRIATTNEEQNLDFKFSRAPIGIQNAMEAHFGLREWDAEFNKLTLQYCIEKSKIMI